MALGFRKAQGNLCAIAMGFAQELFREENFAGH